MAESTTKLKLELVTKNIRPFPDFPSEGILFRDISPILKNPRALTAVIDLFEDHVRMTYPQVELMVGQPGRWTGRDQELCVVRHRRPKSTWVQHCHTSDQVDVDSSTPPHHRGGLDARGFLFGPLLAQRLGVGFALIRKKGKLPGPTVSVSYTLEYGKAEAEIQEDAVSAGQKVLLIDDLLATGGTLYAACELMKKQKADVLGCLVVIELKDLNGVEKLKPFPLFSLVQY
ncbi:adenine phosphoribosyltransferase isoform X1 [Osmerus mordax]|uniref:adenine phosphoribosyltransferase isoform X1 n=1 Tax=Osmerus mordax TaxID=8014 RepID=UPI00351095C9